MRFVASLCFLSMTIYLAYASPVPQGMIPMMPGGMPGGGMPGGGMPGGGMPGMDMMNQMAQQAASAMQTGMAQMPGMG